MPNQSRSLDKKSSITDCDVRASKVADAKISLLLGLFEGEALDRKVEAIIDDSKFQKDLKNFGEVSEAA